MLHARLESVNAQYRTLSMQIAFCYARTLHSQQLAGCQNGLKHKSCHPAQEASLALNEALRKAQQSNDHTALAHALAVLTRLFDVAAPAAAPAVQELRASPLRPHTRQVRHTLNFYLVLAESTSRKSSSSKIEFLKLQDS